MSKRQQMIWETHKRLGIPVVEVWNIWKLAESK